MPILRDRQIIRRNVSFPFSRFLSSFYWHNYWHNFRTSQAFCTDKKYLRPSCVWRNLDGKAYSCRHGCAVCVDSVEGCARCVRNTRNLGSNAESPTCSESAGAYTCPRYLLEGCRGFAESSEDGVRQ